MTDTIKIFLESNIDLLDHDVPLFLTHAYEQLLNSEQEQLIDVLAFAKIDLSEETTKFQKAFIRKNMYMFDGELLSDFVADIPRFDKTVKELETFVVELAPELGFDLPCDEHDVLWIEERA